MHELPRILVGDCIEQMKQFKDNHFDAIVTDPPYGLSFMGKDWDHGVPGTHFWKDCLRVVKPGAHMLAFGGTRTHHRLMVAIEDAGWEIRDCLMWVYGSGFPKSLDVSKALDKAAGVEREIIGYRNPSGSAIAGKAEPDSTGSHIWTGALRDKIGISDAAKQWSGWGTALKPAWEPIILARKPLDGTVADTVMTWGCGGINIDGCRVEMRPEDVKKSANNWKPAGYDLKESIYEYGSKVIATEQNQKGRFPANLIHDGSGEVTHLFSNGSTTSPARFFYCAKASKFERNIGCDLLQQKTAGECTDRQEGTAGLNSPRAGAGRTNGSKNHHPTVKPLALMQYLCRLITPPNGTILDPFAGSGTTGLAATSGGFNSVLIEIDEGYAEIAKARNTAFYGMMQK